MKKKILIVEDQFIIAYDLKQILESDDFEIFFNITTFEAAIELLESVSIDLVLLDIGLKGVKTGLDLGAYINQTFKIPFIYITSFHDLQTLKDVSQTQPAGYLAKPFKPVDVSTAVRLALMEVELSNSSKQNLDNKETLEIEQIPYRIKKVMQYIDEHIHTRIEVETLAQLTNWHKQHFIRIFQKATNQTPYQYILTKKIEKSCEMVLSSDCSCATIAFEFGFMSYANFNKAFKKIKGFTPEQYRMKYK